MDRKVKFKWQIGKSARGRAEPAAARAMLGQATET